jgi:hypothetical protein
VVGERECGREGKDIALQTKVYGRRLKRGRDREVDR